MSNFFFFEDVSCIIENKTQALNKGGLWLGNYRFAEDIEWLKKKQIKTIISVMHKKFCDKDWLYPPNDIVQKIYEVTDSPESDISIYFEESHEYINEALKIGNVFVHCTTGISSSSTIILSWYMKENR